MDIAVIGGGHGCYAAASEFADKGHVVRLWRQNADAFRSVLDNRKLKLTDHLGTRDVNIHLPTLDLKEAIAGAELVVIPLPCTVHLTLAKMIAPHFEDGQVVYIPPATFGTYIFAKALADSGNTAQVAFAETGTLPYLARNKRKTMLGLVYMPRGCQQASSQLGPVIALCQSFQKSILAWSP